MGFQTELGRGLDVKLRSVIKVQVWFSIELKYNFFELDSEVERLVSVSSPLLVLTMACQTLTSVFGDTLYILKITKAHFDKCHITMQIDKTLTQVPEKIRYADHHSIGGFHALLLLLMRLSSPERNVDLEYKLHIHSTLAGSVCNSLTMLIFGKIKDKFRSLNQVLAE